MRADDFGGLRGAQDSRGAVGNEGGGGDGGGAREVNAQIGEERRAGEAEGDLDGFAVAQFPDGGGVVGDGVGGDVGCVIQEDRA